MGVLGVDGGLGGAAVRVEGVETIESVEIRERRGELLGGASLERRAPVREREDFVERVAKR